MRAVLSILIAVGNATAFPQAIAQAQSDSTAEIIRQSAICANNIPGDGLERRGEYLVGWLNVLVPGRHRIDVPGAAQVVVGRDLDPKAAANSSLVVELKRGPAKFIVKISDGAPFQPTWTLPNGMKWDIPPWALYSMTRSNTRLNTLVLPAVTQVAKP